MSDVKALQSKFNKLKSDFDKLKAEVEEDDARRLASQPEAEKAIANRVRYLRPEKDLRLEYALILLAGNHPPAVKAGFAALADVVGQKAIDNIVTEAARCPRNT